MDFSQRLLIMLIQGLLTLERWKVSAGWFLTRTKTQRIIEIQNRYFKKNRAQEAFPVEDVQSMTIIVHTHHIGVNVDLVNPLGIVVSSQKTRKKHNPLDRLSDMTSGAGLTYVTIIKIRKPINGKWNIELKNQKEELSISYKIEIDVVTSTVLEVNVLSVKHLQQDEFAYIRYFDITARLYHKTTLLAENVEVVAEMSRQRSRPPLHFPLPYKENGAFSGTIGPVHYSDDFGFNVVATQGFIRRQQFVSKDFNLPVKNTTTRRILERQVSVAFSGDETEAETIEIEIEAASKVTVQLLTNLPHAKVTLYGPSGWQIDSDFTKDTRLFLPKWIRPTYKDDLVCLARVEHEYPIAGLWRITIENSWRDRILQGQLVVDRIESE